MLIKIIYKRYAAEQNYGFLVMNGGSGWTRTTDLTLIRGSLGDSWLLLLSGLLGYLLFLAPKFTDICD
jgi:hypothetical protein